MPESFQYDVFLSHSSKDKPIVRPLAERLRKDGLRIWFDEWEIKPGDSIPAKIEDGLESSRVLVLCMSENAFGSDWAQLESGTFRFRDPLNKERRFIPVRLDESPIKGSLAQFLFINWIANEREREYTKLREACQVPPEPQVASAETATHSDNKTIQLLSKSQIWNYAFSANRKSVITAGGDGSLRLWDLDTKRRLRIFQGHTGEVWSVAWSADQRRFLSGSRDQTVRVWNEETSDCIQVLKGHTERVLGVSWMDEGHALSCSDDKTIRIWDLPSGNCIKTLEGHNGPVYSVAWSASNRQILSASLDKTVRLWDIEGRCVRVLEGHSDYVWAVAWSPNQGRAISGSGDATLRVWDVESGRCTQVLRGHEGYLWSVAWSKDERHVLTSSSDKTVRLWEIEAGRQLCVLEGHRSEATSVTWSIDQKHALSGDSRGGIRVWNLSKFLSKERLSKTYSHPLPFVTDQVQYTNAKVLLVGDSGVGKTGLARYLALNTKDQDNNSSTDGAWATQWIIPETEKKHGLDREIWLWDFAGQVDYRLVHQLFMDDTAAAVLVFNPQNQNPFDGLGQWDRDLQKATRKPFAKLLVAGRIDRGGLVVSRTSMAKFIEQRGFNGGLYETSAKTGEGCDRLREAIIRAIDWQNIPRTTSPALYHRMKQEVLILRDKGPVLIRFAELKQRMQLTLLGESIKLEELETVLGLLSGPGMIQSLDFGGFILLRPEVLSRYGAALVRKIRKHPKELGCISEDDLLAGKLDFQDFERLPREQESVVLRTLNETLVSRAWCLRQVTDGKTMLTFPSYFRRERPEQPSHPSVQVTYRFDGPADEIYATLVVRLNHTIAFEADQMWQFAADFKTQTGKALGLKLTREAEGSSRLELYFAPDVDENSRVLFARYVHNHLTEHAQNVQRSRYYSCANKKCPAYGQPLTDQSAIEAALVSEETHIYCTRCGKPIMLRDTMEKKFESPKVEEKARQMQIEVQQIIDNESKELILVGHAFAITGEAGQIYRGYTNSDHGIDGEVEFKDDQGRATGKRLYLQLKSGDSYLTKRRRDGAEIFKIKKSRWADYWRQQAYPVMLVIRNSQGEIRWMDVTAYLKRAGNQVKQIVFEGVRFDALSVREWRDKVLGKALAAQAGQN